MCYVLEFRLTIVSLPTLIQLLLYLRVSWSPAMVRLFKKAGSCCVVWGRCPCLPEFEKAGLAVDDPADCL